MSKASEAVKAWRRRTKEAISQILGGSCRICGYNRCLSALEVHHVNPDRKKFTFGGARANPASWKKIEAEVKQCILLCANCHREVEAGLHNVCDYPVLLDLKKLQEVLAIKDKRQVGRITKACLQCKEESKLFPKQIYCSSICRGLAKKERIDLASKLKGLPRRESKHGKVSWPARSILKKMILFEGFEATGKKIGVTGKAVRKRAAKENIVIPKYAFQRGMLKQTAAKLLEAKKISGRVA